MANYDWREYSERSWLNRFPEGTRGLAAWRERLALEQLPARLIEEREKAKALPYPCVLVSHRQVDNAEARRIVYLACHQGFDYWVEY